MNSMHVSMSKSNVSVSIYITPGQVSMDLIFFFFTQILINNSNVDDIVRCIIYQWIYCMYFIHNNVTAEQNFKMSNNRRFQNISAQNIEIISCHRT